MMLAQLARTHHTPSKLPLRSTQNLATILRSVKKINSGYLGVDWLWNKLVFYKTWESILTLRSSNSPFVAPFRDGSYEEPISVRNCAHVQYDAETAC